MLKKNCIITLLLFAYTIVLAHSIIPHHHHNTNQRIEQSEDHNDDDHEGDNALKHSLANYPHSVNATVIHQQPDNTFSSNTFATLYLTPVFEFAVKAMESPPSIKQLYNNYIPQSHYCLSSKGLRAPPSSLV